jgi:phospholipase/lecithinase/hemolysin
MAMRVSTRFVAVFKSWLFSVVVALAWLAPSGASADNGFHHHQFIKSIVVFGDSLSDSGNVFALNGNQIVAPPTYGMDGLDGLGIPEVVSLIPDAPYAGRRFSNGRTWIELIANAIGLGSNAKPALPGALFDADDGNAANYAFGGARANPVGQFPLGEQVSLFLSDINGRARPNALYVIEIGGNDIRDALVAALVNQNPAAGVAVAQAAALSVEQAIQTLHGAGARKFLVWNAPDVGSTPALRRLNAVPQLAPFQVANLATFLSVAYNTALNVHLDDLEELKHIDIVRFNVFEKLHFIQANAGLFGLDDATTGCIEPDVPQFGFPSSPPFRCAEPDDHLFWDGIHPTRAGHRVIAFLAAKELLAELVLDD